MKKMKKRYPPWQQTYTNEIIEMNSVDPKAINIEDIAHALSMQCRYAGHIPKFYSVAEHSYWVSVLVPEKYAMWGLMHDAAEAYITDIPTYVKDCIPGIGILENYLLSCIAIKFNLKSLTMPREVKKVDLRMLMTEKQQFYSKDVRDWEVNAKPYPNITLGCWEPLYAELTFLNRFKELWHDRYCMP